MDKYNYLEHVTLNAYEYLRDNVDLYKRFSNADEFEEFAHEELWDVDEVTGNGVYGYASAYDCEEYLCHNFDLLIDALYDSGIFNKKIIKSPVSLDCLIRIYVLGAAIDRARAMLETENVLVYKEDDNQC